MHHLSINERRSLLLLYNAPGEELMTSSSIPEIFLGVEEIANLLRYDMVEKSGDEYIITDKAKKVIDDYAFVVVYPLAQEDGSVTNFNKVLETQQNKAARALVYAILNTDHHKKWGEYLVKRMYTKLDKSVKYYRSHKNPMVQLRESSRELADSKTAFNSTVNREFEKITNFSLSTDVKFADTFLTHIHDHTTGKDASGNNVDLSTLAAAERYIIVEQYYASKKIRAGQPATE